MMEEEEDMQPFWLQTTDNLHHRHRGLRRRASSIFLNSGVFLIVLLVVAFAFVFFIIPSFLSFTPQIFRPNLIKKSWDSLNLVLVLFAIICGFLSRNSNNNNNNENTTTSYYGGRSLSNLQQDVQKSYPSTPRRWYDYQDRPITYSNTLNRMRSFSSYPDLRQESLERWRFYDDTHLNNYRFSSSDDQIHHHDHHQPEQLQKEEAKRKPEEDMDTKDIVVDTFVKNDQKEVSYAPPSPPLPVPPSPPPAPPPKVVRRKVKRTYQDLGYEKRTHEEKKDYDINNLYIPPPSPPPPSPPPPPPPPMFEKHEKRRGKDFLISLRRKKKKQRQKSVENLDSLFNPQSSTSVPLSLIPPPSPPPPPPPLPPPHFFQNLFSSNKGKPKKLPSVPPPPPPPPPPPVTRVSKIISSQNVTSTTKVQGAPITSDKPPKPVKTSSFSGVEDNVDSGNASPLIPIPPPPPPPPFKMPAWKFVLDGDYVRVDSFNSSRSGSPDLESLEDGTTSDRDESSPMAAAAAAASMPLFCPSPDVNTKADNFIARFRAGLKLEKVNSVKGRSKLGPEASTS